MDQPAIVVELSSRSARGGTAACCGTISSFADIAATCRRFWWSAWLRWPQSLVGRMVPGFHQRVSRVRPRPIPPRIEFFEKSVRPILAARCQGCHGPAKQKGGLRLDARRGRDRRRLDRSGRRAGKPQGEPAGRRHQLRRYVPDAAQVETPRRRDRHPDRMGQAWCTVGYRNASRHGGASHCQALPRNPTRLSKEEFKARGSILELPADQACHAP